MYDPNFRFSEGPFRGRGMYEPAVRQALAARGISASQRMALDAAQPALNSVPNNGVLAWMANYHDPDVVRVLFAPLKAQLIFGGGADGERKVGDMATATTTFTVVEWTGETTGYDDFSNAGHADFNASFPWRQSWNFQTVLEYGILEAERMSLANINAVGEKRDAATWAINQFRNTTYFYGVAGLQNYGILNDPTLPAAIQPGTKAVGGAHGPWFTVGTGVTATPNEIYTDVLNLYTQLVTQMAGLVDMSTESRLTLAMSANSQAALKAANSFGITAIKLIKDNFPNIRFETAPQYNTTAGNLVQLIADEVEGKPIGFVAFTEKLRAFPMVQGLSSMAQKIAGGTWGAVIKRGYGFAQMLGV